MGMSEILGNVDLYSEYSDLSSATKQKIEGEVRRILDESYQRAYKVISERRKELDLLAKALVEYEVLNADEMRRVLKGEKLPKLKASPNTPIKLPELKFPPALGGGPPALPPGLVGGPSGLGGEPPGLGDRVPGLEGARRSSQSTAGADPRGAELGESGGAEW
jgi:ATP-dependent metalloprotease